MRTGERIKERRKELGLSAEDIACALCVSPATIYRYENGNIEKIPSERLDAIASYLNTTPMFLSGWDPDPINYDDPDLIASIPLSYVEGCGGDIKKAYSVMLAADREAQGASLDNPDRRPAPSVPGAKWIPVLGSVAAGTPIEAVTDIVDYEEISPEMAASGTYFALKIKGDSMEPRICDGDVVIVKQQQDADSGDVAVVLVNGDEATVKRIKKRPEGLMLIPANPAYEPMFYSNDDIENKPVAILGRVVELRGKF